MKAWMMMMGMLVLTGSGVAGELPEYYRLLADDVVLEHEGMTAHGAAETAWRPLAEERNAGFAAGLVDIERTPDCDFVWPESTPRRHFRILAQRGEFRAQPLAVRFLREVEAFAVSVSPLTGPGGATIAPENIDIREVKYRTLHNERGELREGNFLKKFSDGSRSGNRTAWLWLTFHAPQEAVPGVYRGVVTLRSEAGVLELPVTLRVLDTVFAYPQGHWGFWIPGHFAGKSDGYCRNYAPSWWNADNAETVFRFWKSRGFNTPVYSGIYPEIRMTDGEIRTDFSEINRLVAAQQAAGVDGGVISDALIFEYWAHAAGQRLQSHHQGQPPAGELGIFRRDARTCHDTGVAYGGTDGHYFSLLLREFDRNARENHWPRYWLYPEEEIDNRDYKTAGYEYFMPFLKGTLGDEHCVVMDNSVGFPWGGLDRGRRDRLRWRSYNNWDREALAAAAADGAEKWTFNQGFNRSSWGVRLAQLGVTGASQWAEAWDGGSYGQWLNAIPVDGKILTSVNYERSSMGLRDLAVFRQAAQLERNRSRAAEDLPLYLFDYRAEMVRLKDAFLEALRYQAWLDGQTAVGGAVPEVAAGSGEAVLAAWELPEQRVEVAPDAVVELRALEAGGMAMDGTPDEKAYQAVGARSGRFVWTQVLEKRYRALAADPLDFDNRYRPVPVDVAVAYDERGVWFGFTVAYPQPEKLSSRRDSGDPLLWQDDVLEVFLAAPGAETFQLICNARDQYVWLMDDRVADSTGIQVASRPDGAGYTQEMFIPWSALRRPGKPLPGERWRFNAGREYHTGQQFTTWAPVRESFGLGNGCLVFGGAEAKLLALHIGSQAFGRNRLSGRIAAPEQPVQLILRGPNRTEAVTGSGADGTFSLEYRVDADHEGEWQLLMREAGREAVELFSFATRVPEQLVKIVGRQRLVIGGDRLWVDVEPALGNAEPGFELQGRLVDASGKVLPVKPLRLPLPQRQRVYLECAGVLPGVYQLELYLEAPERGDRCEIEILPDPFRIP